MNLSQKFPGAPKEAIDFLNRILIFNPFFRITLDEALNHPLFEKVRRPQAESFTGKPIELELEKVELDINSMRELFLKEIYSYNQK